MTTLTLMRGKNEWSVAMDQDYDIRKIWFNDRDVTRRWIRSRFLDAIWNFFNENMDLTEQLHASINYENL
jgi:hypothetical protein